MKKWLFILGVLLWTSCFDDKGNYDYIDLGELTVDGIITDQWYELFAYSDTLKIPIEIHSTRYTEGEEPYTYEWKFMSQSSQTWDERNEPIDYTVSREKNLAIVPQLTAGEYFGFFIVTDTILGLQEKVDFFVRLRTTVSEGWMILCEEKGEARLDWIMNLTEEEERISRNIWKGNNFKLGKPYGLSYARTRPKMSNRYVFTENGTFNLDGEDAHVGEENDVRWIFGDSPDIVHGRAAEVAFARGNKLDMIITRNGNLYARNPLSTGDIYGFPINVTSDGQRFEVAPYFGHRSGAVGGGNVIIYDNTNKRFMALDDDNKKIPHVLTFSGGTADFQAETGRDMVYMDWTKDNYTFALLEDPEDEEMYVYGIGVGDNGINERKYYMKLNRPNKDKITHVAFHLYYRYLFYSTENAVYQFDMEYPETPAKAVLSFPGETITTLKVSKLALYIAFQPWEKLRENQLVVGSIVNDKDEDECGVMRIYDVPTLMGPLEKKKEYTELGKIVDIVYRDRD